MGIEEDIKDFNRFADHVESTEDLDFLTFSFEKAILLSGPEFAALYLKLMDTYKSTKNWWSEGNIPLCTHCGEEISEPKQLRMLETQPYHPDCFQVIYNASRYIGVDRKFFNRVFNLKF